MEIKNSEPLISIITVVYNGDKYLEQTIQSVINQTYKNIEYLIIDGGSTDGTLDIIKKYEKNIAYWVSEKDNGLYDAMNKGISLAKGELIGMINSDDWYELNAIETMVIAYKNNPEKNIFHADRYNVYEDNSKKNYKFNPSSFKLKYYGMTYNHPSMFITKNEYKRHLYNIKFRSHADYLFILESWLYDSSKICYVEQSIVNYRLDGISANLSFLKMIKEEYLVRKNAGINIISIYLSLILKCILFIPIRIKNNLK